MSADVTTFDPTHIDPWLAVLAVLALLVWFAVLEVRASIRQDEEDAKAEEARQRYIARHEARAAHEHPCSVHACTRPGEVSRHGWWLCREDAAERGVSA